MKILCCTKKITYPPHFFHGIIAVGLLMLNSCGKKEASFTQDDIVIQDSDSSYSLDSAVVPSVVKKKVDKKNLVIKEWNTNPSTNIRSLDHVTTYNSEGKKIEEIEYDGEGQKWRERYEYDEKGNKKRELVYNRNNRLVYVKKYKYNDYGKKELTCTFNSQGKVIAIKNYEYLTQ